MQPTFTDTKVYEFAFFRIKSEFQQLYWQNYPNFQQEIARLKGFEKLDTFYDPSNSLEILDHARWDSLKNASKADQIVSELPVFKSFFEPFEQVLLFENALPDQEKMISPIKKDGIMEWYVYEVQNIPAYEKARTAFYLKLAQYPDHHYAIRAFKSVKNPGLYLETFYRADTTAAVQTGKLLEESSEFQNYISTISKMNIYKTFKLQTKWNQ